MLTDEGEKDEREEVWKYGDEEFVVLGFGVGVAEGQDEELMESESERGESACRTEEGGEEERAEGEILGDGGVKIIGMFDGSGT